MIRLRKHSILCALALLAMLVSNATANAGDGFQSPTDSRLVSVPADLSWNSKALNSATEAEKYFKSRLDSEVRLQKSQGAVRLQKIYSPISPTYGSIDWKTYVPDIREYKIRGYDANNKLVRTSGAFPEPTSMLLAASLIYLEQDQCSLKSFNLFDIGTWWQTSCTVKTHTPAEFLRAALRSWLRMTDGPGALASFPRQQLDLCFEMNGKFAIKGDLLTCPGLSKYFNSQIAVLLRFRDVQGGYEIVVNEKAKTYSTKYFAPDFQKLAKQAIWNNQLAAITFSPSSD